MTVVLADLGGTHLRLSKSEAPDKIAKYKIADYHDINTVLRAYAPEIVALYLAAAIQPRDGVIEDCRFAERSHWRIDLSGLKKDFSLSRLVVLNDLEAAAHALTSLTGEDLHPILAPAQDKPHFEHPPKLLIGIGTGIGHAYLFQKPGCGAFVQRSHGGHVPALAVTDEQKNIVQKLIAVKKHGRDLIVEDIVSGMGLANMKTLMAEKDALRLFWEFLGLYCNMLVSVAGAYDGVYLTGGVMDELFAADGIQSALFTQNFIRPLVPVVVESLSSTPVYYVREQNLAIAGLAALAKEQGLSC